MAKRSYGIPYSLDSTYMDMEIAIQGNNGIGAKPMPIKTILLILFGVCSGVFVLFKTPLSRGPLITKIIFGAVWLGLCALLLTYNKCKTLGIERIVSLLNYVNPASRFVSTRSVDQAGNMIKIAGWDYIDDDGIIHYVDKSLGVVFDVIGNASILLFEDHRNAIIDAVDKHYQKMKPKVTYQFITRKEPQKVYMQLGSMQEKYRNVTVEDQDLNAMMETETYVLGHLVGQSFKSLHQYLLIQAPTKEELDLGLSVFYGEVEGSNLMFKYAEQLEKDDVVGLMTEIYGTRKEL